MTSGETTSDVQFATANPTVRRPGQTRKALLVVGLILTAAYVVQLVADIPPPIETRGLAFRTLSGFLLLFYLGAQLYVPLLRFSRRFSEAQRQLAFHESIGIAGIVLLYLHAPRPGAGYLSILAAVMVANVAFGLFASTTRRSNNRWLRMLWLAGHIVSSMFLVVLALFHSGHALYYE